jgi:hypothetical protein
VYSVTIAAHPVAKTQIFKIKLKWRSLDLPELSMAGVDMD